MTHKERMLKAIRGERTDTIPWVPRLDLWYNSNFAKGTLPEKYKGMTLEDILNDLGVGHYNVIPKFNRTRGDKGNIDRGLGLYDLWGMSYRIELHNTERVIKKEGNSTKVEYHTPIGSVSCKFEFTEEMRKAGATISWVSEHIIKKLEDYKVVGYIFRNIKVYPTYNDYMDYYKWVGDKGIASIYANNAASPMQHIMREFMDITRFFTDLYEYPDVVQQLCEDMDQYFSDIFDVVAKAPGETVLFGANYDETLTYPPFFERHIMPYLQRASAIFHQNGKFLISHCDGENKGLLDLLLQSGIDVAEAVCPQPMTKCSIAEIRKAFGDKITIFGGIPSNILLENSMSEENFEKYLERLFIDIAPGDKFILGVADTTPPDAKISRIEKIRDWIYEKGRLPLV